MLKFVATFVARRKARAAYLTALADAQAHRGEPGALRNAVKAYRVAFGEFPPMLPLPRKG